MNTIDTSFTYSVQSDDGSSSGSQIQSPSSPRNSRFEIQFDQANNIKYNSPLNARLMYYKTSPQQSLRMNQYSQSARTSPLQSPRNSMVQNNAYFPTSQDQQQNQQQQNQQQQNQYIPLRPKAPPLLRSTSLPTIQKNKQNPTHLNTEDYKIRSSRSRKSSILTNCTHVSNNMDQDYDMDQQSPETTQDLHDHSDSIISTSSNQSCDHDHKNHHHHSQGDLCKRHHHRRESIAIKFNNPQVINDDADGDVSMVMGQESSSPKESKVFEKLKYYELK